MAAGWAVDWADLRVDQGVDSSAVLMAESQVAQMAGYLAVATAETMVGP